MGKGVGREMMKNMDWNDAGKSFSGSPRLQADLCQYANAARHRLSETGRLPERTQGVEIRNTERRFLTAWGYFWTSSFV